MACGLKHDSESAPVTKQSRGATLELSAILMDSTCWRCFGSAARSGSRSQNAPANQPDTTAMRFSVSVPVLSEQIVVAPPMVSHAASTRTKLLSFIIFFMLRRQGQPRVSCSACLNVWATALLLRCSW